MSLTVVLNDRSAAFNAVFGAGRGLGFASRDGGALWRPTGSYTKEEFAEYKRLLRDAQLSTPGRGRALAALHDGANVLARDGWEAHRLPGWLLRGINDIFAMDVIAFNRLETERLLVDLKLTECSTGVALARTRTSVATAVRKTLDGPARKHVEEGDLEAQWLLERATAAYEAALIKTIGRTAYTRRLKLAVIHGIDAPSLGRCEAAVSAW